MSAGLSLDLRVGDRVEIDGGRIALVLEQKTGQRARIRIEADRSIRIDTKPWREEELRASARGACALPQV